MTALPDPTIFGAPERAPHTAEPLLRPDVTEKYWGYTVSSNETVLDLAVLLRGAAALTMFGSFVGALGVWLLPAAVFEGDALLLKAMTSILLVCLGALLMSLVGRGTKVRVQVDTSVGEVREVVSGLINKEVLLSRYGFDAIEAVEVVESATNKGMGQIHLKVRGAGPVPVGDGSVIALEGLRDRLACDLGLERRHKPTTAIWAGPLVA